MSESTEWAVSQLAEILSRAPPDAKVRMYDADTGSTITKLSVTYENGKGENEFWFWPSDYSEMES